MAAQRLLAFLIVVAVVATLIAFLVGGIFSGLLVAAVILAILWITRALWEPETKTPKSKFALSLGVISTVALAVLGRTPETKPLWIKLISALGIRLTPPEPAGSPDRFLSAAVLVFALIGIFIVSLFGRDKSTMQRHPKPLDEDFPERTYKERLDHYSEFLGRQLRSLDQETRWDDRLFTPLEAEVEVVSARRPRRKIVDLMTALRNVRGVPIVLVLGDPGSGKSIALRRLAKDLLPEVSRTGRVPVYVNLKEWAAERSWSMEAPPTAEDLLRFVKNSMRGQTVVVDQFLDEYFGRMFERGRFYFILDSFDEIPAVLDVSEASWLIDRLSRVLTDFFAQQANGRGIVASRFYRRPRFNAIDSAAFEIRPLSDLRIRELLRLSSKLNQRTIDSLFRDRPELVPVARNPFSASLIRIYAEDYGGNLADNQITLYRSYVDGKLRSSREQLQKHSLTSGAVISGAADIAWTMFKAPEVGLEASVSRLRELLPNMPVDSITKLLQYAGLARLSGGSEAKFSFSHRRINEYFVALRLLDDPSGLKLEAIPTDSRYRDALVLYCEVGEFEHVQKIADFCWREVSSVEVQTIDDSSATERLRAIHCLRFLRDAFRARPGFLEFAPLLAEYISARVYPRCDLLDAKIALEATGLLPEADAQNILISAFEMRNAWISETALRSCRNLKSIGRELEDRLSAYLDAIPITEFLARSREIVFSLSLSDAFRKVRRNCALRRIETRVLVSATLLCVAVSPIAFCLLATPYITDYLGFGRRLDKGCRIYAAIGIAWAAVLRVDTRYSHFICPLFVVWRWSLVPLVGLYFAVAIAVAPLYDTSMLARRVHWATVREVLGLFNMGFWKEPLLLGYLAALVITVSATIFLHLNPLWLIAVQGAMALTTMVRFFEVHSWVSTTRGLIHDRRLLKDATMATAVTREGIASDFLAFKTGAFRLRYAKWLQENIQQPSGTWPGARPNVDDDAASTLLAQLDERWLGLEG